jgi:hypothetical protein
MEPVVFVGWLVLAGLCGFIANQRGRSGIAWGVAAVLMSPVLAYLVLVAIPAQNGEA